MIEERYKLVGTSHVAKQSQDLIKQTFSDFQPDIIAVELDRQRYIGLMSQQKSSLNPLAIGKIGFLGYIFAVIGKLVQNKVGKLTGINPGEEMLLGAKLAQNNKLILCLIDQDIQITLKKLSKKTRFKERMRLIKDLMFPKGAKIKIDLNKVPEDEIIITVIEQMRQRYPGMYSALVDDRNKYMARQVFNILNKYPDKKVMVIIGAGHKKGMEEDLKMLIQNNITRN